MSRLRRGLATGGGAVMLAAAAGALVLASERGAGDAPTEGSASPSGRPVAQELPPGVTPGMVEEGRELFRGAGLCHTCHGRDGTGREGLGSDLTDRQWNHGDGSYEYLVDRIDTGVPAQQSATGMPMPPRGGAGISDDQVEAVAAYVWTLSRRSSSREEPPDGGP